MKRPHFIKAATAALHVAAVLLLGACVATPETSNIGLPVFPPPPDEPRFHFERTIYSSTDVLTQDRNAELRSRLTGERRAGEGMSKPYGVAVYHGRVYVSDSVAQAVLLFDIPGGKFARIGEDDPGRLVMPLGLDVDGKGDLYVVDAASKVVQVYDGTGRFLRSLGGPKWFSRPSGIAVDEKGSRVYVVDTGDVKGENHRVRVFDAISGEHVLDIGKRGSGVGELNLPRDVVIGTNGQLYVVDGGNFRVQVFKADGSFVRSFGDIGRRGGQFSRPKEAAVDPDGNVYIVDTAFGNFQIFNPEGQLLLSVGARAERDGMAKYMLPSGIAIDGDGRVYMVDQFFRKVDVYRPAKLAADAGFAVLRKQAQKNK